MTGLSYLGSSWVTDAQSWSSVTSSRHITRQSVLAWEEQMCCVLLRRDYFGIDRYLMASHKRCSLLAPEQK